MKNNVIFLKEALGIEHRFEVPQSFTGGYIIFNSIGHAFLVDKYEIGNTKLEDIKYNSHTRQFVKPSKVNPAQYIPMDVEFLSKNFEYPTEIDPDTCEKYICGHTPYICTTKIEDGAVIKIHNVKIQYIKDLV